MTRNEDTLNLNSTGSNALDNSGARVVLYKGSKQIASYKLPKKAGTEWKVFKISKGEIRTINKMTYTSDPRMVARP